MVQSPTSDPSDSLSKSSEIATIIGTIVGVIVAAVSLGSCWNKLHRKFIAGPGKVQLSHVQEESLVNRSSIGDEENPTLPHNMASVYQAQGEEHAGGQVREGSAKATEDPE